MKPAFLLVVTSALFLLLPPKSVIAKNASIGIYAIIDHATFEPDAGPPNSVRIFGVFVVPVLLSSGKLPQSSERLPLLSACARYGAGNTMRLERTRDRRWVREGVYTSITRNDALPSASLLGRGYTG